MATGGNSASLWLPYTKTKRFPVERWLTKHHGEQQFCPIHCLCMLFCVNRTADREITPLALHPTTNSPITRQQHSKQLKVWLNEVPGVDKNSFSAVSLRKGALQELAALGASKLHIAQQATHDSLHSQQHYITVNEDVQQHNAVALCNLFE